MALLPFSLLTGERFFYHTCDILHYKLSVVLHDLIKFHDCLDCNMKLTPVNCNHRYKLVHCYTSGNAADLDNADCSLHNCISICC